MPQKVCPQGHSFFKTSDCPVCPKCEENAKPKSGIFSGLSAPARRALDNAGIKNEKDLSKWTEKQLLELHGLGSGAIKVLKKFLKKEM
jgi:predicted RecB family nuclease